MDTEEANSQSSEGEQLYSPLVRRLADEFEVDLATIEGTGPGGRVTRADVQEVAFGDTSTAEDSVDMANGAPATEAGDSPLDSDDGAMEPSVDATATAIALGPSGGPLIGHITTEPNDDPPPDDRTAEPSDDAAAGDDGAESSDPSSDAQAPEISDEPFSDEVSTAAPHDDPVVDDIDQATSLVEAAANDLAPAPEVQPAGRTGPIDEVEPFTVFFDVEVGQLVRAHWSLEEAGNIELPIEALFVRLAIPALAAFPQMNAHVEHGQLVTRDQLNVVVENIEIDLGSGLLGSALLVRADQLSLAELATLLVDASTDADEIDWAESAAQTIRTFTIDHIGATGARTATPLLPPSTTATVSYGCPRPALHLVDGTPQDRTTMTLAGTFDRRATSNGEAGLFMAKLASYLEDPVLAFAP